MVSIQDVAKKAGVSVATVSRVMNNKKNISQKTREQVLSAMKELDYQPNEIARNLFYKKTDIIGVIIPDIGHPFYSNLVREIEIRLYSLGYKIMLCSTSLVPLREKEYIDMLRRHMVDGIIICTHSLDVEDSLGGGVDYHHLSIPLVSINRVIGKNIATVYSDHRRGGELAAKKLLDNGCRQILQIFGERHIVSHSDDRHTEFARCISQSDAELINYRMENDTFDFAEYSQLAARLLKQYPQIDGVFATDLIAAAFIHEAKKIGRSIPEDLKIIGIDGTVIAKVVSPVLTCVRQDIQQLASKSVEALMTQINHKTLNSNEILVDISLEEGETTL